MSNINGTFSKRQSPVGSALILAVVLSSLLAIVGVLFVMVARMNKMTTSAIIDNMELDLAVDTVTAEISRQLALDVPGISDQQVTGPNTVDPNTIDPNTPGFNPPVLTEEYYDYPDANNTWLAALEPYQSAGNYYWRQISDISGQLAAIQRNVRADIVNEYAPISEADTSIANADADGDGVGDSRWIKLSQIYSEQGKPIYAAVRIIDNGAMLNVNTAYKFDPLDPNTNISDIDGTSQLQINLMALAGRRGSPPTQTDQTNLLMERANDGIVVNPRDLGAYTRNVIWRYDDPNGLYTPFDLSDELELRYRFLLNHTDIDTRLEGWSSRFRDGAFSTPVTTGGQNLDAWFLKAAGNTAFDPNYSYRHIATIENTDRIINPAGNAFNNGKMVNINAANVELLYNALRAGLRDDTDPNAMRADELAAQLAVNIVDYRDTDTEVTILPVGPKTYYGFEAQPFISEIAFKISSTNADNSSNNYFAIELYNPFKVEIPLRDFRLELRDANDTAVKTITLPRYVISAEGRFVITNSSAASSEFGLNNLMSTGSGAEDPNLVLAQYALVSDDPPAYALSERYRIVLRRITPSQQLYLDKQQTQDEWFTWDDVKDKSQFYCRNDNNWNIVYQDLLPASNTLGLVNGTNGLRHNYNIINSVGPLICAGDIGRVLTIAPSADPNDMIGVRLAPEPPEALIRVDLRNPVYTNIFQYLTVIDPTMYGLLAGETRIEGRININTAPWFVMAQLPWMEPAAAQAIEAYRDTIAGPFKSIGGLMEVPQMDFYAIDGVDLDRWPDLTPADGAVDDFEERDMIFSRISNLVTVRSDVFTAYVLVRIGLNGPQRRVVAIFDRSQVASASDKIKILAVCPVPDPR
jgi:hypothetical protein